MVRLRIARTLSLVLLLTHGAMSMPVCADYRIYEAILLDCLHKVQDLKSKLAQLDHLISKTSFHPFAKREPFQDRIYLEKELRTALEALAKAKARVELCSNQNNPAKKECHAS